MPTTCVPPCIRLRTALIITVIGWWSANGCIQPGIDSIGTLALEMNENGITSIDMPFAAWALPATSPRKMKIQVHANPHTMVSNTAPTTGGDRSVGAEARRRSRGHR